MVPKGAKKDCSLNGLQMVRKFSRKRVLARGFTMEDTLEPFWNPISKSVYLNIPKYFISSGP